MMVKNQQMGLRLRGQLGKLCGCGVVLGCKALKRWRSFRQSRQRPYFVNQDITAVAGVDCGTASGWYLLYLRDSSGPPLPRILACVSVRSRRRDDSLEIRAAGISRMSPSATVEAGASKCWNAHQSASKNASRSAFSCAVNRTWNRAS